MKKGRVAPAPLTHAKGSGALSIGALLFTKTRV